MSEPKPLRLYPAEALTPENIRRMIIAAAQRGARVGFQLADRERHDAFLEAVKARRKAEEMARGPQA